MGPYNNILSSVSGAQAGVGEQAGLGLRLGRAIPSYLKVALILFKHEVVGVQLQGRVVGEGQEYGGVALRPGSRAGQ